MTPTAMAIPTDYEIAEFRALCVRVGDAVEVAVYGKRQMVDLLLVSLFSGGHVLIEDVPGTGKTTLARSLAAALRDLARQEESTPGDGRVPP